MGHGALVSNGNVSRWPQVRRILRFAALWGLGSLLVATLAIHIQQHILRHRAEALLVDVRQLDLRVATYEQAERIFQRWGPWSHFDGACSRNHCDLNIEIGDFVYSHGRFFGAHPWMLRPYELVGGRPARILARLTVRNGVVWGKSYTLDVEVPPENLFNEYGYTLIGTASSRSRFFPSSWPQLQLHPEYEIGKPGGCYGCSMVYANFTAYATPPDVRRLTQFDLSCLTRWQPCREQADIMPVAWSQYLREQKSREAYWEHPPGCSAQRLKFLGRDADDVAIVQILSNRMETGHYSDPYQVSTVQLVERPKGAKYWDVESPRRMIIDDRDVALTATNKTSELRPGTRFIILFSRYREPQPARPNVVVELCGAIPATEDNLALVLDGVRQDFYAAERTE